MSSTRTAAITLKGTPFDVTGLPLAVGDTAPDFVLLHNSLEEVSLSSYKGEFRIIATVPSLDTPVCQAETKRFNDEVARNENIDVMVVSADLPFAQKRWCGAESVENVTALSCHRSAAFGEAYGVQIANGPLQGCLARAVFVIDASGQLLHVEYVTEVADQPDFAAVLAVTTR
ncbi:MAG: thiol peroxidase [Planctomycetota bacterium]|jgi:thiol peroxidase|nr:thiol peroxidase [Planctomycetota bacterium]